MSDRRPGGTAPLYYAVASPDRVAAAAVVDALADEDAGAVTALAYNAYPLRVELVPGGATARLLTPAVVEVGPVRAEAWDAAHEVTERALVRARALLPARYVAWHEARVAAGPDPRVAGEKDVRSLDDVLALLAERFGDAMSAPRVRLGTTDGDVARVRLYDRFELATGLEAVRHNFFRTVELAEGVLLHHLPGERIGIGSTPTHVRRSYRVLDEYCRARLDLPPRADDEENP